MASVGTDTYLKYNIALMKTLGLWSLDTKSPVLLFLNFTYQFTLAISLFLVSVCQVIEIFMAPDIRTMASVVDLATLTSSGLFKMIYILLYRKNFQDLVRKIDSSFLETDFGDKTVHMSRWMKACKKLSTLYVLCGPITLFGFFFVVPILAYYIPFLNVKPFESIKLTGQEEENEAVLSEQNFNLSSKRVGLAGVRVREDKFYLLKFYVPFDISWSPLYELFNFLELYPLIGSSQVYLVSDTLFFTIIHLVCGQLEILKASLKSLTNKYENFKLDFEKTPLKPQGRITPAVWCIYSKEREVEFKMNKEIIACMKFHSEVIEVIRDLDRMLRSMIVVDFLHAVISLSFALLQTATANALYEWMQMIVFILVCILHQFLNNYFSEILIQQQASVAEVVYATPWVEGSSTFKTAVIMTVSQARHVTRLSGWKMYVLGLPTFVEFMKLLASYFVVLQSLQADEKRGKH